MLLDIVEYGILRCNIDKVVIIVSICLGEVYQCCFDVWVASVVVKDVITDRNIMVFRIVVFASGQGLLHAVGVDTKQILLVACPLLHYIIEQQ